MTGNEMPSLDVIQEYERLRQRWHKAVWGMQHGETGSADVEEASWKALIDFIMANGLTRTVYDPRGNA